MSKLSIITICYNEPNVEKTCESIVNQTWQDFEWIVIDGGSNKETLAVFEKYKYRINKFVSEPDTGIYNACNKGLKLAEGEWVNFINAGDNYHSFDVLEKVFSLEINADILYGKQCQVYKKSLKKSRITNLQSTVDLDFLITGNIATPATFIKRKLFEEFGFFNENWKIISDYEKWVIFAKNGKQFKPMDIVIADFDMSGISSSKKTKKLHDKERNEVIQKYFTPEEIKNAKNEKNYKKLSFIENIFSITNTKDNRSKVITILGIHIKKRRKNYA